MFAKETMSNLIIGFFEMKAISPTSDKTCKIVRPWCVVSSFRRNREERKKGERRVRMAASDPAIAGNPSEST
jgi:hypothetical protein